LVAREIFGLEAVEFPQEIIVNELMTYIYFEPMEKRHAQTEPVTDLNP
jgi:hypothetical protein